MRPTWQEQVADVMDKQSDVVDGSIIQLRLCEGLWEHGSELDLLLAQMIDKLTIDVSNRRKEAEILRAKGVTVGKELDPV